MENKVKDTYPEWVRKYIKSNQEVRKVRDKYYLYQKSTFYDKELGRSRTKTDCYLGRVTEEFGLIPKGDKRVLPRKSRTSKKPKIDLGSIVLTDNVEYGAACWLEKNVKPLYYDKIEKHFGNLLHYIVSIAYCRLLYQSPICDMQRHFSHSFLSAMFTDVSLSEENVRTVLKYIGSHRTNCVGYFGEFISDHENVIFDGTDMESSSGLMDQPQLTRLKTGEFTNGISMMMGFSLSSYSPVYFRLMPGDIKDMKAIRLCSEEIPIDLFSLLADKGFTSRDNIKMLIDSNLNYILPLKRSVKLDYGRIPSLNVATADGSFMYENRCILYVRSDDYMGSPTYIFLDAELRLKEEEAASARYIERMRELDKDYDKRVSELEKEFCLAKKTKARVHESSHFSDKPSTPEAQLAEECEFHETSVAELKRSYGEKAPKFGTIALSASDRNLTPDKIYLSYKERGEVEQMIDSFKTILECDKSHMQDRYVYEGWMFCNFVALQWFYVLKKLIRDKGMTAHHSVQSVLEMLQYVHIAKMNGEWTVIERTDKRQATLDKLGISITYEK